MEDKVRIGNIEVFSTCPQSSDHDRKTYVREVIRVARASEQAGCKGILVYSDNRLVDPWLLSQIIVQETASLCPLVAVQPVYMHPYAVAKIISSLAHLHGRRIFLNMVAGGFKNDLIALNDPTPHDQRYERLIEYTTIITRLLRAEGPVTFEGAFYKVNNLKLSPAIPQKLFPGIFVSGSSDAGLSAARSIDATAIQYPKPAEEYLNNPPDETLDCGIRVGIISRNDEHEAWRIAHTRFPEDRKGQLTHQMAMKVSDSEWHKQLSKLGKTTDQHPYWLVPFENYKTMCPYLVGSYERVGAELAEYIRVGYRTFILDIPPDAEELQHITVTFERAVEAAQCRSYSRTG